MLPSYTYQLADQSHQGQAMSLQSLRRIAAGDLIATFEAFAERWFAKNQTTSAGLMESMRNVVIQNELGVILGRRIQAMPKSWEYKADEAQGGDPATVKELNKWASGPVADRGLSLFAITGAIDKDQELDGNAALVMSRVGSDLRLALRDTCQLGVDVDPLTQEITSAAFQWEYKLPIKGSDKPDTFKYEQRIDASASKLLVNGSERTEKTEQGFGFVPLALIPRCLERGSPVGKSGACDLLEAYKVLLWAAYLLNMANKYEAHGVYCPPPGADSAIYYDSTGKLITSFQVSPGAFYPFPLAKVGGSINIASIAEQYDRSESTLYRLGMVKKDRGDSTDSRSGKAMVIDTQDLRDYVTDKLALRRAGLERVADMWCWATNKVPVGKRSGIVVECEALDGEDPQENTKRGELWLKTRTARECTTVQMLRAWQRLGLIDEDVDVVEMARETEESDDSAVGRMLKAQRAMLPGTLSAGATSLYGAAPEALPPAPETKGPVIPGG